MQRSHCTLYTSKTKTKIDSLEGLKFPFLFVRCCQTVGIHFLSVGLKRCRHSGRGSTFDSRGIGRLRSGGFWCLQENFAGRGAKLRQRSAHSLRHRYLVLERCCCHHIGFLLGQNRITRRGNCLRSSQQRGTLEGFGLLQRSICLWKMD